jgi:hypothetical protein
MKRAYTERKTHRRTGDIKRDLSSDQLAGIGAVALAYNYVESSLDRALGLALGMGPELRLRLVTRIRSEDKTELLKLAAADMNLPSDLREDLAETSSYFLTLKGYRNGIIHARVLDAALGLGEVRGRGARHWEVLLTKDALDGLYEHLKAVANELASWILIWYQIRQLMSREADDPERSKFEKALLGACSQYQARRTERQSLPKLPEFPSESEMQEAWAKARAAEDMAWFQPLPTPSQRSGLVRGGEEHNGHPRPTPPIEGRPREKIAVPPTGHHQSRIFLSGPAQGFSLSGPTRVTKHRPPPCIPCGAIFALKRHDIRYSRLLPTDGPPPWKTCTRLAERLRSVRNGPGA